MSRDDEIYALCEADKAIFFPGCHRGRADVVRALLADGWSVTWTDKSLLRIAHLWNSASDCTIQASRPAHASGPPAWP